MAKNNLEAFSHFKTFPFPLQRLLYALPSAGVTIACAVVTAVIGIITVLLHRRIRSMAEGNKIPGPRASVFSGNDDDLYKAGGPSGMSGKRS